MWTILAVWGVLLYTVLCGCIPCLQACGYTQLSHCVNAEEHSISLQSSSLSRLSPRTLRRLSSNVPISSGSSSSSASCLPSAIQVLPFLWLGDSESASDFPFLLSQNISRVISILTDDEFDWKQLVERAHLFSEKKQISLNIQLKEIEMEWKVWTENREIRSQQSQNSKIQVERITDTTKQELAIESSKTTEEEENVMEWRMERGNQCDSDEWQWKLVDSAASTANSKGVSLSNLPHSFAHPSLYELSVLASQWLASQALPLGSPAHPHADGLSSKPRWLQPLLLQSALQRAASHALALSSSSTTTPSSQMSLFLPPESLSVRPSIIIKSSSATSASFSNDFASSNFTVQYSRFSLLDDGQAFLPPFFHAFHFLLSQLLASSSSPVLIHCAHGKSRSPAFLIAYLLLESAHTELRQRRQEESEMWAENEMTESHSELAVPESGVLRVYDPPSCPWTFSSSAADSYSSSHSSYGNLYDAFHYVRQRRPCISIRYQWLQQLMEFERILNGNVSMPHHFNYEVIAMP